MQQLIIKPWNKDCKRNNVKFSSYIFYVFFLYIYFYIYILHRRHLYGLLYAGQHSPAATKPNRQQKCLVLRTMLLAGLEANNHPPSSNIRYCPGIWPTFLLCHLRWQWLCEPLKWYITVFTGHNCPITTPILKYPPGGWISDQPPLLPEMKAMFYHVTSPWTVPVNDRPGFERIYNSAALW